MEFKLNEYHNNLTDEQLLQDIKKVAQDLSKDSITRDEYDLHGKYHSGTIRKRFGGWLKALDKAYLPSSCLGETPGACLPTKAGSCSE